MATGSPRTRFARKPSMIRARQLLAFDARPAKGAGERRRLRRLRRLRRSAAGHYPILQLESATSVPTVWLATVAGVAITRAGSRQSFITCSRRRCETEGSTPIHLASLARKDDAGDRVPVLSDQAVGRKVFGVMCIETCSVPNILTTESYQRYKSMCVGTMIDDVRSATHHRHFFIWGVRVFLSL